MSTSQTTFGEAAAKLLHFTADRLAVCVDAEENTEHELENIERLGRLILGALDLVCTIEQRAGLESTAQNIRDDFKHQYRESRERFKQAIRNVNMRA